MWDSWAELSPTDAAALGIGDGDRLRIESPSGSIEVAAVIDPAVRPGLVGVPRGLGYRDYGRYARGRGVNPLDLVGELEVAGQAVSAWAATRVRIERLGPGTLARYGARLADRGEGERIPVGWAPQGRRQENLA
jgi:anaerobic selenocysteine-containing dehydrogenase